MTNVEPLRPIRPSLAHRVALQDLERTRRDLATKIFKIGDAVARGTPLDLWEASHELAKASGTARHLSESLGLPQ